MRAEQRHDWRTIGALNAVSTLAQVGQFGIAYVVVPVWLAGQGLGSAQLSLFASSLWLGQLPGLAMAPALCSRFGARTVITAGLLSTILALALIAMTGWPFCLLGGALAGLGLGLRWIGLEPWLYHIAPSDTRGRLVGFHESLIALAPVVAPALASQFGLLGKTPFWIGAAFTLVAFVPLIFARSPETGTASLAIVTESRPSKVPSDGVFRQGVVIALLGGMLEAAVSGLFALYTQGRGISVGRTADLLVVFGLGGLLMQYGAGWLADHRGLRTAAVSCALGAALVAVALVLPLSHALVAVAVFLLGGYITAFLTLAIIASTLSVSGSLPRNVSVISMLYTGSAIGGPLVAGSVMKLTHTDALMWFTATVALIMAAVLGICVSSNTARVT